MIVMAFDVATKTGWAVYDTKKPPSSIVSGCVVFEGKSPFEKVFNVRRLIPKIIREHKPEFCVMEACLPFIPRFRKKTETIFGEETEEETLNAGTALMLSRLAGAVQICISGLNIPCTEVAPRTWQSIIPRIYSGEPKARVKQFAESLKIVAPNADARDAAIIALWAAGHCQRLKMMELAQA